MNNFSERHSSRRVVVVLPDHEYEELLNYDARELLHAPQVNVIRYGDIASGELSHPVLQRLERQGVIGPGKVLIQDPFAPDTYYEQADALTQIALRKHFHLSVLCQKLGATSLKVTQVDVEDEKVSSSAGASGKVKGVDAKASYQERLQKKLRNEMNLNEIWSGGEPDLDGARDYIDRHFLESDANIVSLVEMMSHKGNRLSKRKLIINASLEANRNLKICAGVGLAGIGSLKGSFDKETFKSRDVKLTIEIEFKQCCG